MQTKKQSHLEVLINQCLGLAGGWLIGFYFTIISLIRSYLVRRYFDIKSNILKTK